MNDEVRMLIRYVCDGDIKRSQAQAQIILRNSRTQKDSEFVKSQLKKLEDSKARFIELPYNLQSILVAEDSSFFPVSRFLLRPKEESVIERILKIARAASVLKEMNISFTPSLMLYGESGTGKTMLAKYIAYRAGIPYVYVRFSGLINSQLGKTQENLNRIFTYAKQKPCVLCIDEIDTIAMRRGQTDVGEMNRVVISLMQELDQLPNDMIVVATTNRYDQLDSALLRRFTVCQQVTAYNHEEACHLLHKFFNFAEADMTEEQLHKWVEERFPNTKVYYPSALTNAATQYLVDTIVEKALSPNDQNPENTSKQIYILYEEIPDCMGSGSTSREVARTSSFPQALEMLKNGAGNSLVKRSRVNGVLVETHWNEFSKQFE
jgi:SpoVK/Ycf46/Vps4 family AAA+-type ATPase